MSSVLQGTGGSSEPMTGQLQFGTNQNQVGLGLAVPAGGPWRFSLVGFYAAGVNGSSPLVYACIWHGNGTIVGYSTGVTLTNRGFGLGASDLYQLPITSPPGGAILTGGLTYYFGWQREYGGQHQYGYINGNSHVRWTNGTTPGGIVAGGTVGSGQEIGVFAIYDPAVTNVAPNAPTALTPNGGIITGSDLTPALAFLYTDPDSNPMSAYQIQVSTASDFSTFVNGWDSGKTALVQAHNTTVIVSPTTNLVRGGFYYWRARVWDNSDVVSGWSA